MELRYISVDKCSHGRQVVVRGTQYGSTDSTVISSGLKILKISQICSKDFREISVALFSLNKFTLGIVNDRVNSWFPGQHPGIIERGTS